MWHQHLCLEIHLVFNYSVKRWLTLRQCISCCCPKDLNEKTTKKTEPLESCPLCFFRLFVPCSEEFTKRTNQPQALISSICWWALTKQNLEWRSVIFPYLHMTCRFLLKANLSCNVIVQTGANGEPGQSAVWWWLGESEESVSKTAAVSGHCKINTFILFLQNLITFIFTHRK